MIDWIFDLLPDETGEYIGCGLATGATVAITNSKNKKIDQEKLTAAELKKKINDLSSQMQEKCFSEDTLNYIKAQGKK